MRFESEAESLERRLTEAEENLRLIRERKSEFVQQTDIPLQLIKEERRLEQEVEALRAQLAQLPPPREEVLPPPSRLHTWPIVAGLVGLVLVLAIGIALPKILAPSASPTSPPPSPSPALLLERIGDPLYSGCNVRAITLTESGVLVALDGPECEEEGVKRVGGGGQGADPGNPAGWLMSPLAVVEGPDGRLWVGTVGNGLVELAPDGTVTGVHTQTADGSNIAVVNAVALDDKGGVWVGAGWEPGLYLLDAEDRWHTPLWESERFPVYDIELDERGQVWLATFGGGARCLDSVTYTWKAVYNQRTCPGCLPSDKVFAAHIAPDGRKWVGTDGGLAVLGGREGQPVWRVIDGLPHSRVVALAGDNEGHIFVGTEKGLDEGGLAIVDEELSVVEVLSFDHNISALAFDPEQDRLWVGTLGEGLSAWSVESRGSTP